MKRLEVLRQLAGTVEGIRMLDGMFQSLAGREVKREAVCTSNPEVRDMALAYLDQNRRETFVFRFPGERDFVLVLGVGLGVPYSAPGFPVVGDVGQLRHHMPGCIAGHQPQNQPQPRRDLVRLKEILDIVEREPAAEQTNGEEYRSGQRVPKDVPQYQEVLGQLRQKSRPASGIPAVVIV